MNESPIEIYQIENGSTEIQVKLDNETVWLSLNQITELFGRDKSVISRHGCYLATRQDGLIWSGMKYSK